MVTPDFPFWLYSTACYRLPDVASKCNLLQDRYGADVNIVLFCLWVASLGVEIPDASTLRTVTIEAERWHKEVVSPLREIRQALRHWSSDGIVPYAGNVREATKSLELITEKLEQSVLARALSELSLDISSGGPYSRGEFLSLAATNLGYYAELQNWNTDEAVGRDFGVLAQLCASVQ